jgi:hypothetical protein
MVEIRNAYNILVRKSEAKKSIGGHTFRRECGINPLKQSKFIYIIFKNSVGTSKTTQRVSVTKINWLMLLIEIIGVYNETQTKPVNTVSVAKCRVT